MQNAHVDSSSLVVLQLGVCVCLTYFGKMRLYKDEIFIIGNEDSAGKLLVYFTFYFVKFY